MIPQDTTLFHRSIRDNICYGKQVPPIRMDFSYKQAHAHDFIGSSQGYDTIVGERGGKLSGGQCRVLRLREHFSRTRRYCCLMKQHLA